MRSNSLPYADLNLPEIKTKSPSCLLGGAHMYVYIFFFNMLCLKIILYLSPYQECN